MKTHEITNSPFTLWGTVPTTLSAAFALRPCHVLIFQFYAGLIWLINLMCSPLLCHHLFIPSAPTAKFYTCIRSQMPVFGCDWQRREIMGNFGLLASWPRMFMWSLDDRTKVFPLHHSDILWFNDLLSTQSFRVWAGIQNQSNNINRSYLIIYSSQW